MLLGSDDPQVRGTTADERCRLRRKGATQASWWPLLRMTALGTDGSLRPAQRHAPAETQTQVQSTRRAKTWDSPLAQLVASPATLAAWATWPPTRFAVVARVVDVLAGGPIRGGLQAHDAVAPLDAAATGADGRVAATETPGRGVCGDRRRPRSQMTERKARVHVTTALWPGRSGAGEGVGAGRRPAAVEIGDGRRCGPFCGL